MVLSVWAKAHGLPWLALAGDSVYLNLAAINLSWAQELATYMFIWMAKFGAALGVRTGIHVGVDVLVDRLDPAARRPVIVFALLCGALFTGVIGTLGAVYVYELDADQVSQELEWPSWMIYLCIPLGSYLMSLSVPAGGLALPAHRFPTASRPRRGHRIRRPAGDACSGGGPMTTAVGTPARPQSSAIVATLLIALPIALALICLAARLDVITLSQSIRAALLFVLLLALMATGMPISIALGLSVLTYLFILSSVDPKMVGLKLFTSLDRFEIMAIPFFILAGNFLTSGGVARRMIAFATSMIGHWYGGLGTRRRRCLRIVRRHLGFFRRHRGRDRLDHPAGDRGTRLSAPLRRRCDRDLWGARHPVPALDQPRDLRGRDQRHAAARPRRAHCRIQPPSVSYSWLESFPASCWPRCSVVTTWYRAWRNDYPRMKRASWGECLTALRESFWGLFLIILVLGGIYAGLFTPTEAAAWQRSMHS